LTNDDIRKIQISSEITIHNDYVASNRTLEFLIQKLYEALYM